MRINVLFYTCTWWACFPLAWTAWPCRPRRLFSRCSPCRRSIQRRAGWARPAPRGPVSARAWWVWWVWVTAVWTLERWGRPPRRRRIQPWRRTAVPPGVWRPFVRLSLRPSSSRSVAEADCCRSVGAVAADCRSAGKRNNCNRKSFHPVWPNRLRKKIERNNKNNNQHIKLQIFKYFANRHFVL